MKSRYGIAIYVLIAFIISEITEKVSINTKFIQISFMNIIEGP